MTRPYLSLVLCMIVGSAAGCSEDAGTGTPSPGTPDVVTPPGPEAGPEAGPPGPLPDASLPDARPDVGSPPDVNVPDINVPDINVPDVNRVEVGPPDAGPDVVEAGRPPVNKCATFIDRTAADADRTLVWDFSIGSKDERCMRVRAGQTVTWNTPSATHPLTPLGGDTPTPIPTNETKNGAVTFPNAGVFGYVCANHSSMNGAIEVVP